MATSPPIEVELPADLLAGMLDRCWKSRSRSNAVLSARPLMGVPREPNRVEAAALALHGLLKSSDLSLTPSPAFATVARILLAPKISLTLRSWHREPWLDLKTNLQFSGKEGVALNQLGDGRYRLKNQIQPGVAHQSSTATFFQKAARAVAHPVEALLAPAVATMFCACIDFLRDGGDEGLINPAKFMKRCRHSARRPGSLDQ